MTVYAETGTETEIVVYQDAYLHAALVILGFIAIALGFALADLRARSVGAMHTLQDARTT